METTTNSIAACAANTPARGRFGIKNVTSGRCPNFKPNRPLAGMEPAQSAIELEVVEGRSQTNAGRAKALKAADTTGERVTDNVLTRNAGNDKIKGLSGSDLVSGGACNDHIDGGEGADMIGGGQAQTTSLAAMGMTTSHRAPGSPQTNKTSPARTLGTPMACPQAKRWSQRKRDGAFTKTVRERMQVTKKMHALLKQ